jgi:hypothetical protein
MDIVHHDVRLEPVREGWEARLLSGTATWHAAIPELAVAAAYEALIAGSLAPGALIPANQSAAIETALDQVREVAHMRRPFHLRVRVDVRHDLRVEIDVWARVRS